MPQPHATTGPVRFLSTVRFLARKAEWLGSGRRNFLSVLFSWSHQATGPVRFDTAVYLWFGWKIRRSPRVPRAVPVRASYGPRTGIFNVFHILRDPYGGPCVTRKGAVRRPYGHARELAQPELAKIPHGRRIWPYGARKVPLRSPHGLFTGCLRYLNPYGAHKLIMHALKLYGPRTGRQNPHGARAGPLNGRTIFVQNSPGTAVRALGVWCDWGTNAGRLLNWPLRTNISEMLLEIHSFSFKKMHFKMSSGKWRPFVN